MKHLEEGDSAAMSVVRTIVGTIATKGVGLLGTMLVSMIIYRSLGAAGKGEVDVMVAWGMLLLLCWPSCEEPQLFLLGEGKQAPSTFFANGLALAAFFGAVSFGVFQIIIAQFPHLLEFSDAVDGGTRMLDPNRLVILVAAVPLVILQRTLGGLLQGLRDMKAFNLCFLAQNFALLGCAAVFVWWQDWGILGAVMAHAISQSTGGLTALLLASRHPAIRGDRPRPHWPTLKRMLVGGLRIHGGVIAAWLILVSDQLILMRYWGQKYTAWYVLAVALSGQLRRLVLQPVKEVLMSRLPSMVGDVPRMTNAVAQTSRHVLLLSLVPASGLVFGGWLALYILWGPDATAAYSPLMILVPASLIWAVAVILSYWFIGRNRFVTLTIIGLTVAATNVGLNFLFVPQGGMIAAALTSLAAYTLHISLFLTWIWWFEGVSPMQFIVPKRRDFEVYGDAWRALLQRLPGRR